MHQLKRFGWAFMYAYSASNATLRIKKGDLADLIVGLRGFRSSF
jgi:hypothetical protein